MRQGYRFNVGDIQIDDDKTEWVIVGVGHMGLSRVRRNSLAHKVHAESSPDIARSYSVPSEDTTEETIEQ